MSRDNERCKMEYKVSSPAIAFVAAIALAGCQDAVPRGDEDRAANFAKPDAESESLADDTSPDQSKASEDRGDSTTVAMAPIDATDVLTTDQATTHGQQVSTDDTESHAASASRTRPRQEKPSLETALADLQIPPPWLNSVVLDFDTTQPWNKAWDRIEQLLMTAKGSDRQEAVKLAYVYQEAGRAKTGYPASVYFLAGERAWAIREFLALEEKNSTTYMRLASCYLHFGEYGLALENLEKAETQISETPPWDVFRRAQVLEAKGDVYADMKDTDAAREAYRQAVGLYDQAALPSKQQYVKTRSIRSVKARLDILDQLALLTARLQDGTYDGAAPGYTDEIQARVTIERGRIADIQVDHQEKADLQATRIIPERIIQLQDLRVDAISGATITSHAVKASVFEALKKSAGLN